MANGEEPPVRVERVEPTDEGQAHGETKQASGGPPDALVKLTHVIYGLYAASLLVGGLPAIVAIVINYVKQDEARGTFLESHFRWQIRTFWFMLLWCVVGGLLTLVVVGFAVLVAAVVWYIYRIVKGWLALQDGKPIEAVPVRVFG